MSIFKQFATDPAKESEGVAVEFLPNEDGTIPTFFLAAASRNNQRYAKELEKATKPWRRNMDAMGDANAERIYKEVFLKNCLKGWKNVQREDGTEIAYSAEAAKELFNDPTMYRLYDELTAKAASIELFQDSKREEEAGN